MDSIMQTVEKQGEIIRIQSEIIDDLFNLLAQHISVQEAEMLPFMQKLNTAGQLSREIGE